MKLLVLVPDPGLRGDVRTVARAAGYAVGEASGPESAGPELRDGRVDAALVDVGDARALGRLDWLRREAPGVRVIAMGTRPRVDRIVEAYRRGARDFLRMPFDVTALERVLARSLGRSDATSSELGFLTRDPATRAMLAELDDAARSDATIQIVGESGTGKELLARRVHEASGRRAAPCCIVRCAGLPEDELRRELFGSAGGSQAGGVEAADGGTLVLADVTELPPPLQPELLRVVQEGRVPGRPGPRLDLRIVATLREEPAEAVAAGRLRPELATRLDVVTLRVAPLRERPEDLALLARRLLARFARSYDEEPASLDAAVLSELAERPLRGNVRELENLMKRAAILFPGRTVEVGRLDARVRAETDPLPRGLRSLNLRELERAAIASSLEKTEGNRTLASRALGISVRTLRNKIRLYELA